MTTAPALAFVAAPGLDEQEPEEDLWRRWRELRDDTARSSLLAIHMPYARVVAAIYFAKRFHDQIEFADYLQLASIGLLESFDRYDPAFGVQFRSFAARRMHGAILDGLEVATEKQQQIAARTRLEAQRRAELKAAVNASASASGGQSPATAGSPDQVLKYVAEVGIAFALAWILDGTGMVDASHKTETVPFYRSVEIRELRQRIIDIVNGLPAQERKVIRSHYLQEASFKEIAHMLGVSRGRVSQIHRKALLHLREVLRKPQTCNVSW